MAFASSDPARMALFAAVQEYLEMGLSIIPVNMETKKPFIKWADYQNRLPTTEEWEAWATKFMDYGIALVCGRISGIVVLDMDNPEAQMWAFDNQLFSDVGVKTKRGTHAYYRHPGIHVAPKVGGVGTDWPDVKGLDLRGDGSYALLPPTKNYEWLGIPDFDSMPVWKGVKKEDPDELIDVSQFSFDELDLSGVGHRQTADEKAREFVAVSGKKMGEGDGRNALIAQFAGEQVAAGVIGERLIESARKFQDEWFKDHLEDRELLATVGSVVAKDKRDHPERWEEKAAAAKALEAGVGAFIMEADLDAIASTLSEQRWLVDPIIAPGEVTHVTAYSGHGKSLLTLSLCKALAAGRSFGPFDVVAPAKVLYVDAENPLRTQVTRWQRMRNFGPAGKNLMLYSMSKKGTKSINLNTKEDCILLLKLVEEHKPDVVVLDTIRSLFIGLDENKATGWSHVNQVSQWLKALGCAVVLLHHRNKPNEFGLGMEAGNTAQLTLVDVQIVISQVYRKELDAKAKAGLWDQRVSITYNGVEMSPWQYIDERRKPSQHISSCFHISYGKTRTLDDNQRTTIIGYGDNDDGLYTIVAQPSAKQQAKALHSRGVPSTEIRDLVNLPLSTLSAWLK